MLVIFFDVLEILNMKRNSLENNPISSEYFCHLKKGYTFNMSMVLLGIYLSSEKMFGRNK